MARIFHDADMDKKFARYGFVVKPFLSAKEVEELRTLYREMDTSHKPGFYATLSSQNEDYRRYIDDAVRSCFMEKLENLLPNYRFVLGSYIIKKANTPEEIVNLHQDYTFSRSDNFPSVLAWCPLVDVDQTNGCLFLLAGSHTFFNHISAMPANPAPYTDVLMMLRDHTVAVPMKAGSILLYDNRLLHGSFGNQTDQRRLVASAILVHRMHGMSLFTYDLRTPSKLHELALKDDYMFRIQTRTCFLTPYPQGVELIRSFEYQVASDRLKHIEDMLRLKNEIA